MVNTPYHALNLGTIWNTEGHPRQMYQQKTLPPSTAATPGLDLPLRSICRDLTVLHPPFTVLSTGSHYRETEHQLLQLQVEPRWNSTLKNQPQKRGNDGLKDEILGINGSEVSHKRCWGAFKNPAKDQPVKKKYIDTLC